MTTNRKTKKILLSIFFLVLSYGFIIFKITNLKELKELSFSSQQFTSVDLFIFLVVILLMLLNWSIETIKWKILIDKIQYFSFFNALQAVLSGITVGIFTPNRVGEIGGRVIFMDKGKRTYGVLATGIGSFSQFITSISAGILGFILFLLLFPNKIVINPIFNKITVLVLLIILAIQLWVYFNIKKIRPLLIKISFFETRTDQLNYLSKTKSFSLLKVLLLSIARYCVFISQFFLLLILFNINLSVIQAFISISLIYLFTTLVPTTTLLELGIRGSLAIFFIGMFSNNILGIVLSTSLLWLVNLAVPSIVGTVFFIKNKL